MVTTSPSNDISIFDATNSANVYFVENFDYESSYDFVQPGTFPTNPFGTLGPEGNYTIDTNPRNSHTLFNSFP